MAGQYWCDGNIIWFDKGINLILWIISIFGSCRRSWAAVKAVKYERDINVYIQLEICEISSTAKISVAIPIQDLRYWPTGTFYIEC